MSEKWSKDVKETPAASKLPEGLFKQDAKTIAEGLKKAVTEVNDPDKYRSTMSMLDFYINRAGSNLTPEDRTRLDQAKVELRKLFGREQ